MEQLAEASAWRHHAEEASKIQEERRKEWTRVYREMTETMQALHKELNGTSFLLARDMFMENLEHIRKKQLDFEIQMANLVQSLIEMNRNQSKLYDIQSEVRDEITNLNGRITYLMAENKEIKALLKEKKRESLRLKTKPKVTYKK